MYLGLKRNPMPGTLRTDLHGVLHVFHGTVYGYLVLFTYFLGESLERRPGEPVWEIPYCPRCGQWSLGNVRVQGRTYGDGINEELSGYHSGRQCLCCIDGRAQKWVVG